MYTEQELKKAADIIKKVAEDNNVSEDQVRADMQEAMDCGRNCPDPIAQKLWEGFHYAGSEPTLEEFAFCGARRPPVRSPAATLRRSGHP